MPPKEGRKARGMFGLGERRGEEKGNKDLIPLVNLYLISGFMV